MARIKKKIKSELLYIWKSEESIEKITWDESG